MKTRNLPHRMSWSFEFKHSIADVWSLVSDTDRMNRAIGLTPVEYRYEKDPNGGSLRYGKTKLAGFTLEWFENPYEWVLHQGFAVHRSYSRGPLKNVDVSWEFTPTKFGCRLVQTVAFEPKIIFLSPVGYLQLYFAKRSFLKAYINIEAYLNNSRPSPYSVIKDDHPTIEKSIYDEVIRQLGEVDVAEDLARKLARFVFESPQSDLIRIKPFVLAKKWAFDKIELLGALLKGTNRGVFSLYWDLVCPRCQGAKTRLTSLASLNEKTHCDSCNIDFSTDFDKSVEITFSIHPKIRKIEAKEYCIGGPQNTPHFISQVRISPFQTFEMKIHLPEGVFRMRSLQAKGQCSLEVNSSFESSEIDYTFGKKEAFEVIKQVRAGLITIKVSNEEAHEIVVIINRETWRENICSAAFVTSLQEFRDRFASDVLAPDQEISVNRMTILFTDLKGSTQMYQDYGDAKAYKLVRSHFEIMNEIISQNEGAIVKTIGDAVMASFLSPALALKSAIQIQREILARKIFKRNPSLKIGLHTGSCFVVNAGGKLDYFGANVNIAARTNGQAEGGDIILTQYMMNDPDVQKLVETSGLSCRKLVRNLKGFQDHFVLYQIQCDTPVQNEGKD